MSPEPHDALSPRSAWTIVGNAASLETAAGATLWYVLITLAMTWPVIAGLGRDVTSDLGDPLLNCWILGWNAERLLRILSGDFSAIHGYFNANIYYPEPLALAYSEHLFASAVQILPIYALTHNVILCYNVTFLLTFVLSGLGTYLLVRELTGSARAAFIAGLIYAFTPYRIGQYPHVQVLTSQWMPFVLFGFRRYFTTRRLWPLAGGALAFIAQNLSCGYYLLYFAPFVALYVLYEMVDRRLLRQPRVWIEVALAAAVVVAVTLPFLLPYQELRGFGNKPRDIEEVKFFSADVYGYFTTSDNNRLWGGIVKTFVRPEGELFPSFTSMLLALFFVLVHARRGWQEAVARVRCDGWRRKTTGVLAAVLGTQLTAVALILAGFGGLYGIGGWTVSIRGFARPGGAALLLMVLMAILSQRVRAWLRGAPGSDVGYLIGACILAWFLSLGPEVTAFGRPVAPGLYTWLYDYVPGYDGLRVPARYGMVVMVFLATLAGYGVREIERRIGRGAVFAAIGLAFMLESIPVPVPMNRPWSEEGLADGPPRVYTGVEAPPVYRYVRDLPPGTAIIEFPFGANGYELLAVFYASQHWKPIVNGYSGGSPPAYHERVAVLRHPFREPDAAWSALLGSRATHAIVHDGAYKPAEAIAVNAWLVAHGASHVATFDTDHVYRLPPGRAGRMEKPPGS